LRHGARVFAEERRCLDLDARQARDRAALEDALERMFQRAVEFAAIGTRIVTCEAALILELAQAAVEPVGGQGGQLGRSSADRDVRHVTLAFAQRGALVGAGSTWTSHPSGSASTNGREVPRLGLADQRRSVRAGWGPAPFMAVLRMPNGTAPSIIARRWMQPCRRGPSSRRRSSRS
jgi:hypothetical protein